MNTTTNARVALVTGGSAGLGLALSRGLAAAGWRVITDGRSAEKFKEADLPDRGDGGRRVTSPTPTTGPSCSHT